ncbi:MAG: hypothetical protein K6G29_14410 [Clostridiales bacterium]|nr:hypothetical protein [Clostridiales bacterium]
MKKVLSCALAICMLLPVFAGCAEGGDTETEPTIQNAEPETEPTEETERFAWPNYGLDEGLDYAGGDFTMLVNAGAAEYFTAEEMNGETLNDALFARNSSTEEALNVRISVVEGNDWGAESVDRFRMDVGAGASSYQLFLTHTCAGGGPLLLNGCILDMAKLDKLDFSMPWWSSYIIRTLNFNDRVYFCAGDLNLTTIAYLWVLLFNRQVMTDYGREDPYDLVAEGKWTMDVFREQLNGISRDLDGDGNVKLGSDLISLTGSGGLLDVFIFSCGSSVVSVDESGPVIVIGDEKTQNILERFVGMMIENDWHLDEGGDLDRVGAFCNNQVYFFGEHIGYLPRFSECEAPYGVVPYPKYDEAQPAYYSYAAAEGGILCMPVTLTGEDADRTAAVTQMLAGKNYESVTSLYYDTMLKTRYARDQRTAEMVDICFRGVVYDFGFVYDNWVAGLQSAMYDLGIKKDTGLQSYVAKKRKGAVKYFDKVYAKFFD